MKLLKGSKPEGQSEDLDKRLLLNNADNYGVLLDEACGFLDTVVLGKHQVNRLSLACLIAGGHLLFDDLPGLGKTTLSRAIAQVFGLDFKRVQFTSDLLPADLVGTNIFNQSTSEFQFRKGPLFSQMVLADEINRAPARTQSALLEAMAERQISADGASYPLSDPFVVVATQNPQEQAGTFALPESQLDRFMMCLSLGYPSMDAELCMLKETLSDKSVSGAKRSLDLKQLRLAVDQVSASDEALLYLLRLVAYTRVKGESYSLSYGVSPRGTKAVLQAAKAWALLEGRFFVLPDDIQAVAEPTLAHRLPFAQRSSARVYIQEMLAKVPVFAPSS